MTTQPSLWKINQKTWTPRMRPCGFRMTFWTIPHWKVLQRKMTMMQHLYFNLKMHSQWAETVQNDAELCAFYSSYQEARKRLSEKVRFRGFWAVKRGEKGSGKKGKVKGKGKSSLANRIANSYCRICMKKGHWKNECPSRSTASSAAPSTAPTSFVTTAEIPEELLNLSTTEEKTGVWDDEVCLTMMDDKVTIGDKWGFSKFKRVLSRSQLGSKSVPTHLSIRESIATLRKLKLQRSEPHVSLEDSEHLSLFASSGSIGIVDLGASQTVIGSKQVPELLKTDSGMGAQPCSPPVLQLGFSIWKSSNLGQSTCTHAAFGGPIFQNCSCGGQHTVFDFKFVSQGYSSGN